MMSGFFSVPLKKHGKLNLEGFILPNRTLHVPPSDWSRVLASFTPEEVLDEVADIYDRCDLINPLLANRGLASAVSAFNKLKSYDTTRAFVSSPTEVFTRQAYAYNLNLRWYLQAPSSFNDASDYFHRYARMSCGHANFRPPLEAWNDRPKRRQILKSLISLKAPQLSFNTIEAGFSLRSYVASQFRAAAAKAIYDLFQAHDVFDPSAGWGDRFAGFSASQCTRSYVGTDPNESLHDGYWAQGLTYGTGKAYEFICQGAEDVDLRGHEFDLVFTSPPYFNTEQYSHHEGQSWLRYKEVDAWQNQFLHRMIANAWRRLRPGGTLALNIADLGTKNARAKVCDPMNEYIATLPRARYAGGIGMRLQARPQTGLGDSDTTEGVVFVEPVWVWTKGRGPTVEERISQFLMGRMDTRTSFILS